MTSENRYLVLEVVDLRATDWQLILTRDSLKRCGFNRGMRTCNHLTSIACVAEHFHHFVHGWSQNLTSQVYFLTSKCPSWTNSAA